MDSLYRHIAIEGNIGTGKTTIATLLSNILSADLVLESFKNNPFLDQFYASEKDIIFQLEMFFLAERYHQMSRHLLGDIFTDHIVADYFFSKSSIFGGINLAQAEKDLFMNLFNIMERFMPVPDILIYLHNDIATIEAQITSRGRSNEQNIPTTYLQKVERAYFDFFKTERRMPVVLIDLSSYKSVSPEKTLALISEVLSKEWANGIHQMAHPTKNAL